MVKEVNDSLQSSQLDPLDAFVPFSPPFAPPPHEPRIGVVLPTEQALREHNEELEAHEAAQGAAAAAAAVLRTLPLAAGSDHWCDQSEGWALPQLAPSRGLAD